MSFPEIDWYPTLISIGVPEQLLNGKHQPCPFCGGKDRFRFTDYQGVGMYHCNGCGTGDGFGFIKNYFSCTFEEALIKVNSGKIISHHSKGMSQERKYEFNRTKLMMQYRALVGGRDTPAHKYLNKRGIPFPDPYYRTLLADNLQVFGCFWLPEFEKGYGAMVWKVIEPKSNSISQLHFTSLTEDGYKAPVKQVKKYSSAIGELDKDSYRVAPLVKGDPNNIIISEGIETALACRKIMEILAPNEAPATIYASMDAGMLKRFRPFEGDISKQTYWICGDRDESNTGQQAAAAAAMNIRHATGRDESAYVVLPPETGKDWADVLLSGDMDSMMHIAKPLG